MDYDDVLGCSMNDADQYEEDFEVEVWPIVRIILQYEDRLSDGFGHYSNYAKTLMRIANRIEKEVFDVRQRTEGEAASFVG